MAGSGSGQCGSTGPREGRRARIRRREQPKVVLGSVSIRMATGYCIGNRTVTTEKHALACCSLRVASVTPHRFMCHWLE